VFHNDLEAISHIAIPRIAEVRPDPNWRTRALYVGIRFYAHIGTEMGYSATLEARLPKFRVDVDIYG
jgi:hypothetical protein